MKLQPYPDVFDGWTRNLADIVFIRVFHLAERSAYNLSCESCRFIASVLYFNSRQRHRRNIPMFLSASFWPAENLRIGLPAPADGQKPKKGIFCYAIPPISAQNARIKSSVLSISVFGATVMRMESSPPSVQSLTRMPFSAR